MKLLLYEPGTVGHRSVILSYTVRALSSLGIPFAVETKDFYWRPYDLVKAAIKSNCDVIYVLTADGRPIWLSLLDLLAHSHRIDTICTYYLYTNLTSGWKSWIWRFLIATGNLRRIFVSDTQITEGIGGYPKQVRYLPDPWDPRDFCHWDQQVARVRIGLPESAVVFMMFGELSARKGVDQVFELCLKYWDSLPPEAHFLFVGRLSDELTPWKEPMLTLAKKTGRISFWSEWIPEEQVSLFFYACDFVMAPYPPWFGVSSGTVTRALASRRMIICSDHGATGALIQREQIGYSFRYGDFASLCNAIQVAVRNRNALEQDKKLADRIDALAGERTLDRYTEYLGRGVDIPIDDNTYRKC